MADGAAGNERRRGGGGGGGHEDRACQRPWMPRPHYDQHHRRHHCSKACRDALVTSVVRCGQGGSPPMRFPSGLPGSGSAGRSARALAMISSALAEVSASGWAPASGAAVPLGPAPAPSAETRRGWVSRPVPGPADVRRAHLQGQGGNQERGGGGGGSPSAWASAMDSAIARAISSSSVIGLDGAARGCPRPGSIRGQSTPPLPWAHPHPLLTPSLGGAGATSHLRRLLPHRRQLGPAVLRRRV